MSKVSALKNTGREQTDFSCKSLLPGWATDCKLLSVQPDRTRVQTDFKNLICKPVINFADTVVVNHARIVQGQPQKTEVLGGLVVSKFGI